MRHFDDEDIVAHSPQTRKYLISLYWSVQALTTVGFGDITAESNGEIVFSVFMTLIGATLFSYITATVSSVRYITLIKLDTQLCMLRHIQGARHLIILPPPRINRGRNFRICFSIFEMRS